MIWSTVAIDQIVFAMVLPVLPFLARRYSASPFQVTALVASYALAQFVLSPFLGSLSDRVGRKPVLVVSLFGSAVGSLVVGLAGALPLLFLGRVIDGASGTALISAQTAITDMVPPRDRARYLGLMGSAFAVGFVVGPALTGLTSTVDTRLPFFVAAGLALANALAAIVRLPETHPPRTRSEAAANEDSRPFGALRGARSAMTPAAWFYVVAFAASLFAFASVEGGAFTLLTEVRFDFGPSQVAGVFVLVGVILAAVQVLLVGPTNERLGIRGTAVVAMLLNSVGFALTAAAAHVPVLLAGAAANATGQGLLRPTATAAISNAVPARSRGAAIGVLTSAQGAMRIAGPLAAGALFQVVGPWAPFAAATAISLVVAAVTAGPGRRHDEAVTQAPAATSPAP